MEKAMKSELTIQNIFLNKKIQREQATPKYLKKSESKNELSRLGGLKDLELSLETTLETERINDIQNKLPLNQRPKKIESTFDNIFIPSFLNDDLLDSEARKKIKRYNKIKEAFKDEEEAERYLVKKEIFLSPNFYMNKKK